MKKIVLNRIFPVSLGLTLILFLFCACGDLGATAPTDTGHESYLTPTVDADGKAVYSDGDTTLTVDSWVAEDPADNTEPGMEMQEVTLKPSEMGEDKYQYVYSNGTVAARLEVLSSAEEDGAPAAANAGASTWGIDWELYPGDYYLGDDSIGAADGEVTLSIRLKQTADFRLYVGYYVAETGVCTWLETPVDGPYHFKLTVYTETDIQFALKHAADEVSRFLGKYWVD